MAKLGGNALKHGLSAKTLILQNEDPAEFQRLLQERIDEWQPATPTEMELVTDMVAARWRLLRIYRYQTAMVDLEMDMQAPAFEKRFLKPDESIRGALAFSSLVDNGKALNTAHRFEVHYLRSHRRALDELRKLQNERREPPCGAGCQPAADCQSAPNPCDPSPTPLTKISKHPITRIYVAIAYRLA